LQRADSGTALAASGDLVHTGPTGTNVGDLVIGLKLSVDAARDLQSSRSGTRSRMLLCSDALAVDRRRKAPL
jgi:hypothetical protein